MNINTPYNIDDRVFLMRENVIVEAEVQLIRICIGPRIPGTDIDGMPPSTALYNVRLCKSGERIEVPPTVLFSTIRGLVDALACTAQLAPEER